MADYLDCLILVTNETARSKYVVDSCGTGTKRRSKARGMTKSLHFFTASSHHKIFLPPKANVEFSCQSNSKTIIGKQCLQSTHLPLLNCIQSIDFSVTQRHKPCPRSQDWTYLLDLSTFPKWHAVKYPIWKGTTWWESILKIDGRKIKRRGICVVSLTMIGCGDAPMIGNAFWILLFGQCCCVHKNRLKRFNNWETLEQTVGFVLKSFIIQPHIILELWFFANEPGRFMAYRYLWIFYQR